MPNENTLEKKMHLFLVRELRLPDVRSPQFYIQHSLHDAENLLVGRGGSLLKVLDDRGYGVALCGEFLLGHLVWFFVSALLDGVCDLLADCLWLDDVVASVDLC